jgi:hypothetical protein
MTAIEIYAGSDGDATKQFYAHLEGYGPRGIVALNLFRASKCSARAKLYRRRRHKASAYDRKNWSLENLVAVLLQHADALGIVWGWKLDPTESFAEWVLYVELPAGQVSFHSTVRMSGPDYAGEWDRVKDAQAMRVIKFCDRITETVNA